MNKLLKYTLLVLLQALAACSSDDGTLETYPTVLPQPGDALQLNVSAGDFMTDGVPDTRATDNGAITTLEGGDRVGVIVLGEDNKLIYDNIPYVYKSGEWTFDSGNDESKGGCYYDPKASTYIVYYPYSHAADGVTSVDKLKAKFAPKFDQSAIKDYRASDLMVWSSPSTPPATTLNAKLTHAFASVYFAPAAGSCLLEDGTSYTGSYFLDLSAISDVSLTIENTVYVPYKATDGSLRCIIPAGMTPGDMYCFYTIGSDTYGNTISISGAVAANTRYTSFPKEINKTYTFADAHVGDFYCINSKKKNEGYLIPNDAILTPEQQASCVGVVCWVGSEAFNEDPLLRKHHSGCKHGLVVALKDAGGVMNWSNQCDYVQDWVNANKTYMNVVDLKATEKMCGYSNTLALRAYNEEKGDSNGFRVLPCDAVQQYSKENLVPTNSSGWYFPSVKELKFVSWGQGNILNTSISKVGGSFVSDSYWSSTESDINSNRGVFGVNFSSRGSFSTDKNAVPRHVRPFFAF